MANDSVGRAGGLGSQLARSGLRAGSWVLRLLGQILVILVITLALDYVLLATVLSDWKQRWQDAATAYTQAYVSAPYDHDLAPDAHSTRAWGNIVYPWRTDRYGFRTGDCAPGEAEKSRPAIFAVGDSFTEGIGTSYEKSFVGLMACDAARQGKAVWNLGVASYSPVIYFRKIREAVRRLGVKPAEIYVFLDLSDIDDDANVYHLQPDGTVKASVFHGYHIGQFLLGNFATFRLMYNVFISSSLATVGSVGKDRALWTVDPDLMASWGWRGLETAGKNLDEIVAMCREWHCRMTLVVYPWPDSLVSKDRNSIQVTHWRDWAASRQVRFINGFAPFFDEPAPEAVRKYFIGGDIHFSEAGNRLLYETVKKAVDGDF